MYEFRRNIKPKQRLKYGFFQFMDHFFGREKSYRWFEKSRRAFYKDLHKTLKESGEGTIKPIERRKDLSLKEFRKHYLRKGIPVVIEGAAKDWDCVKNWSHDYFKELHGQDEIVMVHQGLEGYPHEVTTLAEVLDNIRGGGKKYYRFYPLLERHPEHIKDFDYKWLLDRSDRTKWVEAFQAFIGGKDSVTNFHNASACNLFVQVSGEKRWILYSEYYTSIFDCDPVNNLYRTGPDKTPEGPFDPFNPNYETPYTLFKYIDGYEVHLKPGDVFYNPPYYWHAVYNTTDSIGVGYRWLSPYRAFRAAPLYFMLDLFAKNPPIWKSVKLANKDLNLVQLAETGRLDQYLKEKKQREEQKAKI